jgi:hypothetical protein
MNYFLITLCLVFPLGIKSSCIKGNSSGLSVKISLAREYFVPYDRPTDYVPANDSIKEKRFDVQISIINNSDSAISIWLMTCSWEDDFLVNNTYISFAGKNCDGNFPMIVRIEPKDSLLLNTTLARSILWDNPCKNCIGKPSRVPTTKIGLIYIDKINCKGFFEYINIIEDKSQWNIIWSNSLDLSK